MFTTTYHGEVEVVELEHSWLQEIFYETILVVA